MTIFEKIVAGEIPCNKVLENDKFLAFNDINPKAPIHILIIPKKHFENFQEMDGALMGVDKSGYRLVTNCGENGGQEVMHLHFHLLAGAKLGWVDTATDPQSTF